MSSDNSGVVVKTEAEIKAEAEAKVQAEIDAKKAEIKAKAEADAVKTAEAVARKAALKAEKIATKAAKKAEKDAARARLRDGVQSIFSDLWGSGGMRFVVVVLVLLAGVGVIAASCKASIQQAMDKLVLAAAPVDVKTTEVVKAPKEEKAPEVVKTTEVVKAPQDEKKTEVVKTEVVKTTEVAEAPKEEKAPEVVKAPKVEKAPVVVKAPKEEKKPEVVTTTVVKTTVVKTTEESTPAIVSGWAFKVGSPTPLDWGNFGDPAASAKNPLAQKVSMRFRGSPTDVEAIIKTMISKLEGEDDASVRSFHWSDGEIEVRMYMDAGQLDDIESSLRESLTIDKRDVKVSFENPEHNQSFLAWLWEHK